MSEETKQEQKFLDKVNFFLFIVGMLIVGATTDNWVTIVAAGIASIHLRAKDKSNG